MVILSTGRMWPVHDLDHFWAEMGLFHARVACDPCLKMDLSGGKAFLSTGRGFISLGLYTSPGDKFSKSYDFENLEGFPPYFFIKFSKSTRLRKFMNF